jgi:hypothetical protein
LGSGRKSKSGRYKAQDAAALAIRRDDQLATAYYRPATM